MADYGFNFQTLYYLELKTLYDIVQLIRGEGTHIAPDYDVMIRGCILPFLRSASRAPEGLSKDAVMRVSLIAAARRLGIDRKDWKDVHTDHIATQVRDKVQSLIAEKLESLSEEERAKILGVARNNLTETAKAMGVPLAGAGALVAGELSGFGVYLATTTGLHALSLALGTTFSWGVYQGATALLGVIIGPVGWAIAGVGVVGTLAVSVWKWMSARRERVLVLVVVALAFAIGENPYDFFGLQYGAPFEEGRTVYRAMMKTLHPDRLEKGLPGWLYDDFNDKLLRCQDAYDKLERVNRARGDQDG